MFPVFSRPRIAPRTVAFSPVGLRPLFPLDFIPTRRALPFVLYAQREPRECSSRVRHRTDRGLHPVISGVIAPRRKLTKAAVLTSGSVITRDYATPKRRALRLHDRVHGTTVDLLGRNYSVFSELVALPTAVPRRQLCIPVTNNARFNACRFTREKMFKRRRKLTMNVRPIPLNFQMNLM